MAFSFSSSSSSSNCSTFANSQPHSNSSGFTFASATSQTDNKSEGKTCRQCNSVTYVRPGENLICRWCNWSELHHRARYLHKLGVIASDDPTLIPPPLNFGIMHPPQLLINTEDDGIHRVKVFGCKTSQDRAFRPLLIKVKLEDRARQKPPRHVEIRDTDEFDLRGVDPGNYALVVTVVHFCQESSPTTVDITVAPPIQLHELGLKEIIMPKIRDDLRYEDAALVPLDPIDSESETIAAMFQSAVRNATIVGIYRVHCMLRTTAYEAKREQFAHRLAAREGHSSSLNEVQVWHGTSVDIIPKILHQGFLRQFSSRAAFGAGSYFAVDAAYSAKPVYARPDAHGYQHVLFCRVLAGDFTKANQADQQPPMKRGHIPYDSTVDNVAHPRIHIIYGDDQAIADFVVSFRV